MNKKNYGTIPYYDFLTNQRQVCTILISSIIYIFFIAPVIVINKTAGHQKNYNLSTEQTNNTSSFQYILTGCGDITLVPVYGTSTVLVADPSQPNYKWSTGETTQSITVNASGIYWWETIDMANNQVKSGDFTLGDDGEFASDYGSATSTIPTAPCTSNNCTLVPTPL
jgi:hypothetical protein